MPDTYTPSLRIVQQTVGGNENTWGGFNNSALAMLDQGIAGIVSISVTAGNVTLSTANNADDQARNALIIFTGTPAATRTVTMPDVEKLTWVFNNCSDGSSITFTSGAGTTVSVPALCKALVYTDGATNVVLLSGPYGEGTWTPALADNAGNGFTMTTQIGLWTRVGNLVFASFTIVWTSIGAAGATQLRMNGLPFAAKNTTGNVAGVSFSEFSGLDTSGGLNVITCQAFANLTRLTFRTSSDNAASAALAANSCSASGTLAGSVIYIAA